MTFIDDEEKIFWKIVQKGRRWLPGFTTAQMSGIVLNPLTISDLFNHFQIKGRSLFNPLSFEKFFLAFKIVDPFHQLLPNPIHGAFEPAGRGDIMTAGVNRNFWDSFDDHTAQWIHPGQNVNLIPVHFNPETVLLG